MGSPVDVDGARVNLADLVRVRPHDADLAQALRVVADEVHTHVRIAHDAGQITRPDRTPQPWRAGWADAQVRAGTMPIADFVLHLLPKTVQAETGARTARWWRRVAQVIDAALPHGYTATLTKHYRVIFSRHGLPFIPHGCIDVGDLQAARQEISAHVEQGATRLRLLHVPDGSPKGLTGVCVTRKNSVRGVLSRPAALAARPLMLSGARTMYLHPDGIRCVQERAFDRTMDATPRLLAPWTWTA